MAKVSTGGEGPGDRAPYVVNTGRSAGWYIGLLVIFLLASAVVGGLAYYFGKLSIFGTVACATGVIWSAVAVFQSTRTEWIFRVDGITRRETGLFKKVRQHITPEDIVAIGIETQRGGAVPNPVAALSTVGIMDAIGEDLKRKVAGESGPPSLYRLAFKLRSGEVLKVDREQGREEFVQTLQALARRMPHVTWPTMS